MAISIGDGLVDLPSVNKTVDVDLIKRYALQNTECIARIHVHVTGKN